MAEIRDKFGLRIVTEAMDTENLDLVADYADVIQIGARNMQNYTLLKAVGRKRQPVDRPIPDVVEQHAQP